MSNRVVQVIVLLMLVFPATLVAQITVASDTFTNTNAKTTNYGGSTILAVQPGANSYIRFDFSRLPASATSSSVTKATVRLFVSGVTAPGSFDVVEVTSQWSESTLTFNTNPLLGPILKSGIAVTAASKNNYIILDLTSEVQKWLGSPV